MPIYHHNLGTPHCGLFEPHEALLGLCGTSRIAVYRLPQLPLPCNRWFGFVQKWGIPKIQQLIIIPLTIVTPFKNAIARHSKLILSLNKRYAHLWKLPWSLKLSFSFHNARITNRIVTILTKDREHPYTIFRCPSEIENPAPPPQKKRKTLTHNMLDSPSVRFPK